MKYDKFNKKNMETKSKIATIEFAVLSNEEIRQMSNLSIRGVNIRELYDGRQEPRRLGLIDARLGGFQGFPYCDICYLEGRYCEGHPYKKLPPSA